MFFFALVFLTMALRIGRKIKTKTKHNTQNQWQTALEWVRAQCLSTNDKLYDACNECTYDACSNAQKLVQFDQLYQQLT